MPQSYQEYSGSSLSATTYSVTFKYLSIDDVHALGFDGNSWTTLTLDSSSPRDATNKTITLASAPSTYTKIRLYRATATTALVDFQNGSRLSEADLDTAYQQGLFVAQEVAEDANTNQFDALRDTSVLSGTQLTNFASQSFTATSGQTEFTITSFTPQTTTPEAFVVSIDGAIQAPSAYTVSVTDSKITFSSGVPLSSVVVIVTGVAAASATTVDNSTLEIVTATNQARVKDGGITSAKLSLTDGATISKTGTSQTIAAFNTTQGSSPRGLSILTPVDADNTSPFRFNTGNEISFEIDDNEAMRIGNDPVSSAPMIQTSGKLKLTNDDTVFPNDLDGGLIQLSTVGGGHRLSIDVNEFLASQNFTFRVFEGKTITFAQVNSAGDGSLPLFMIKSDGEIVMAHPDGTTRFRCDPDAEGMSYLASNGGANIELYGGSHSAGSGRMNIDANDVRFRNQGGSAVYAQTTGSSANAHISSSTGRLQRTTSSARYKENIQDYDKGIEAIKSLRPVSFQTINEDDDKTYAGFIAEEVHDAELTEFVDYNKEGQPDALHYANMTAVLTKALQEALTKIESLEARVEALENA